MPKAGLTDQHRVTAAQWYSNKTSLPSMGYQKIENWPYNLGAVYP